MKVKFLPSLPSLGLPGYKNVNEIKKTLATIYQRALPSGKVSDFSFSEADSEIDFKNLCRLAFFADENEKTDMHILINNFFDNGSMQICIGTTRATKKQICEATKSLLQFLYPESGTMEVGKDKYLGDKFIQFNKITPILVACSQMANVTSAMSNLSEIKKTFSESFNLNFPDAQGVTPLHFASIQPTAIIFQWLYENGASPSISDSEGLLPVHYAAKAGNLESFKYLTSYIHSSIDIQATDGRTPAHFAAENQHFNIIEYISDHGGNCLTEDHLGRTCREILESQGIPIAPWFELWEKSSLSMLTPAKKASVGDVTPELASLDHLFATLTAGTAFPGEDEEVHALAGSTSGADHVE